LKLDGKGAPGKQLDDEKRDQGDPEKRGKDHYESFEEISLHFSSVGAGILPPFS
jgi:hypothetical protein